MIQGVLFDMDGILFNTERCYLIAEADAARRTGIAGMDEEYFKQFCGMNSRMVKEILARDYPDLDVPTFRALCQRLTYELIRREGLEPMPHVETTLQWLKENGYKTAVASSTKTERVQEFLALSGFGQYFDAVVGGDQVEKGKPDPDIFVYAAGRLGLGPQSCVGVEDSYNGIRSAHAAGCVTVMVPDMLPPTEEMRQKSTILADMSQLPDFILRQNRQGA